MKNIVQSVQPSAPLKAVETANKSVEGVTRQHSDNPEQHKDFQSMLERQVEDKRLQEKESQSKKGHIKQAQSNKDIDLNSPGVKDTVAKSTASEGSNTNEPALQDETVAAKSAKPAAEKTLSPEKSTSKAAKVPFNNQLKTAVKDGSVTTEEVSAEVGSKNDSTLTQPKGALKTAVNPAPTNPTPKETVTDVSGRESAVSEALTKEPRKTADVQAKHETVDATIPKTTDKNLTSHQPASQKLSETKLAHKNSEQPVLAEEAVTDAYTADIEGVDDLFVSARKPISKAIDHSNNHEVAELTVDVDTQKTALIRGDISQEKLPLHAPKIVTESTEKQVPVQAAIQSDDAELAAEAVAVGGVGEMAKQKMQSDLREQMISKSQALKAQQFADDKAPESLNDKAFYASLNETTKDNTLGKARLTDLNQSLQLNNFQNTVKLGAEQASAAKPVSTNPLQTVTDFSASTQAVVGTQSMPAQSVQSNTAGLLAAQQTASTSQIYQQLGKPGWNQAVNQKVLYMVGNGDQTAKLTLNPPDLGPLQVVVNVNNDKADTTFISNNADVRQALEDGMENLRAQLDEAGISLGQANVNTGSQFEQHAQAHGVTPEQASQITSENEPLPSGQAVARETNGLVDVFA